MQALIQALQTALQGELPGYSAQLKMSHSFRNAFPQYVKESKDASVLILFYAKNKAWHIPLIQRPSSNPNDPHSGQIAFPGGRYETEDGTFQQAALREAYEEVGIKPEDVQVLGKLTPLYIPVSGYLVHPFVGYLAYEPTFVLQKEEVHSVIEAPLVDFQDEANLHQKDMQFKGNRELKGVDYFDIEGKVVWGATAMMMNELLEILKQIEVAVQIN